MEREDYYMDKLNIEEIENVAGGTACEGFDLEGDSGSDDMENFGNDYYGSVNSTLPDEWPDPMAKKYKGANEKIKSH